MIHYQVPSTQHCPEGGRCKPIWKDSGHALRLVDKKDSSGKAILKSENCILEYSDDAPVFCGPLGANEDPISTLLADTYLLEDEAERKKNSETVSRIFLLASALPIGSFFKAIHGMRIVSKATKPVYDMQ